MKIDELLPSETIVHMQLFYCKGNRTTTWFFSWNNSKFSIVSLCTYVYVAVKTFMPSLKTGSYIAENI